MRNTHTSLGKNRDELTDGVKYWVKLAIVLRQIKIFDLLLFHLKDEYKPHNFARERFLQFFIPEDISAFESSTVKINIFEKFSDYIAIFLKIFKWQHVDF